MSVSAERTLGRSRIRDEASGLGELSNTHWTLFFFAFLRLESEDGSMCLRRKKVDLIVRKWCLYLHTRLQECE